MNDPDPDHVERPEPQPRPRPPERSIGMTILKFLMWSIAGAFALVVLGIGLILGTCFLGR